MAIYLNNNARDILEIAQLLPAQEQTVATYIVNYGDPRGSCFDNIAWLAYRIWNAIKAIFGMSDWQEAMAIVKNKVYEAVEDITFLGEEADQSSYREFIELKANEFASGILDRTLGTHDFIADEDGFIPIISHIETLHDVAAKIRERAKAAVQEQPPEAPHFDQKTLFPASTPTVPLDPLVPDHENFPQKMLLDFSPGQSREIEATFQKVNEIAPEAMPQKIGLNSLENFDGPALDPTTQVIVDTTPEFNAYKIAKDTSHEGTTLSSLSLRPSNLFFKALGVETTMPGGELFSFQDPDRVHNRIIATPPDAVVEFSATNIGGMVQIGGSDTAIADLAAIYGNNTYRISYKELQDILASQRIYCSPMLPKRFYRNLKEALLADGYIVLPGNDSAPIRMNQLSTPRCKQLIGAARTNPKIFGFTDAKGLEEFLNLSIYQVGAMIVKTEDFYLFADGNGQIFERNPGEQDAIRLITACQIRGIRATPGPINSIIMENMFKTALKSAEKGFLVFPAVGMDDWRAFLHAVATKADTLEKIFVNPRHQKARDSRSSRDGDEFEEFFNEHIAIHTEQGNEAAVANLKKIVNLYDKNTDLLQLAYNLKTANPDETVSLFNGSDPDVTLGNHVAGSMNKRLHGAPTTEEHYSMMGTKGLCFEQITRIRKNPYSIIQID